MPHVIGDAAALRALTHPVRLALLDALAERPLSATEAGERIGESSTTCSYHLRQLARSGFVELHERGPGRRRVWRRVHDRWQIAASGYDEVLSTASRVAHETMLEYYFQRIRTALGQLSVDEPGWQQAALGVESRFYVTAAELEEYKLAYERLNEAFVKRWSSRTKDRSERPYGARQVEILVFGVPVSQERHGYARSD